MILFLQDKVEVLEFHSKQVNSARRSFALPSVLKLKTYIRPWIAGRMKLSRENIYLRDNYTCQYCAIRFAPKQLTFDHVVPVSKGGQKSWENIVTACQKCNHKKSDRTPREAGMPLLNRPKKPNWRPKFSIHFHHDSVPDCWAAYMPFKATS